MIRYLFLTLALVLVAGTYAQKSIDVAKTGIKLTFSGYVKNDFFWDTRQTVSAREGHFLLFPSPVVEDPDGQDINADVNFNFLAIQSRLSLLVSGGRAFNSDVTAKIEGDFFGQTNPNINLLRLRLAYINMDWGKTEVLFGQYWMPMFITDCFPGTVSFNTGAPLQPFGRNPQVRATRHFGKVKLVGILNSQRDYVNRGDIGPSSTYIRNSGFPEVSLQLHYASKNETSGVSLYTGIGASYKTIRPRLESTSGYKDAATVGGMNAIAYMKIVTKPVTFKIEGVYGENITEVLSIGGFIVTDSVNLTKRLYNYSPLRTMSFWAEVHTNGKTLQVGLFGGYTQNMGSSETVGGPIYGLATNIYDLYRISPRVIWNSGRARFALEFEYTAANYGSAYNANGQPVNLTLANNLRTLLAVYYFF